MAREVVERINVEKSVIEYVQSLFEDYKAKQDLLTMIFELHKEDESDLIISSKPFQSYEKRFAEAKVAFDEAMNSIKKEHIPDKYDSDKFGFEVNFVDNTLDIYKM